MDFINDCNSELSDVDDALVGMHFLNVCKMYKAIKERKKRRQRRWYIRPANKDWLSSGYYQKVFKQIKDMDDEQFFQHTRMTKDVYEVLLSLIKSSLRKPNQRISPEERLSITLLYLSHASSMQSIACSHKLGKTTIRNIILEVCDVLWSLLSPVYVSEPTTSQYVEIEKDFAKMLNIPNCVGAIDGKHIALKCPNNSASMVFNSKYSVVLMGVCDAKYTFTAVTVGSCGSHSDGGIFRTSQFGQSVFDNTVAVPPDKPLPSSSSSIPFPHFFVANAAFPLRQNLMRPYPPGTSTDVQKTVFNYRLSRAQRVIENAFGILSARWRILLTNIECSAENCEKIVLGCVALHNFVMASDHQRWYCPSNFVDGEYLEGEWRNEIRENGGRPLRSISNYTRRRSENAVQLRNRLAEYFNTVGQIPGQNFI